MHVFHFSAFPVNFVPKINNNLDVVFFICFYTMQ